MDKIGLNHIGVMVVNAMGGHGDQIFKSGIVYRIYDFNLVGMSCSLVTFGPISIL